MAWSNEVDEVNFERTISCLGFHAGKTMQCNELIESVLEGILVSKVVLFIMEGRNVCCAYDSTKENSGTWEQKKITGHE